MMEIAKNVKDFLVGMKETLSPEEENLLSHLQDLHEHYLKVMDDFSAEASNLALSRRPEARMMSHQLRVRIYQDWRAKMMERIFTGTPLSGSPPTNTPTPPEPIQHRDGCDESSSSCICELELRLSLYKDVVQQYLDGNARDTPVAESEDGGQEYYFEFPEFLGMAPLRERLQS